MIRLANDINGFYDANNTNMMYISHDRFPAQKSDFIGKWTALRYKSEYNDMPTRIRYTDGTNKIFKRNGKYYYDEEEKTAVPEYDKDGNPIVISEVVECSSINNRHVIDRRYYPNLTFHNSGITTFFQILRYDLEAPYKVILRSKNNEVIVLTVDEFTKIYDLEDSNMQKRLNSKVKIFGGEYISPNTTSDIDEFLDHYNNEKINVYPIQNDEILGINVYTEYDLDLFNKDLSYTDNKMDKYTYKDINNDRVTVVDSIVPESEINNDNYTHGTFNKPSPYGSEINGGEENDYNNISYYSIDFGFEEWSVEVYEYCDSSIGTSEYGDMINGGEETRANRINYEVIDFGFEADVVMGARFISNLNSLVKYGAAFDDEETDRSEGFTVYQDNLLVLVPEDNYPIEKKYNNRFEFTARMRENLIKNNSSLKGYPDVTLQSFDRTYNVHAKSKIDTPRRAINKGVIIRADINAQEPYIVVAEKTDMGVRVVCSDEARFFFDTVNMHRLHSKKEIQDMFNTEILYKGE